MIMDTRRSDRNSKSGLPEIGLKSPFISSLATIAMLAMGMLVGCGSSSSGSISPKEYVRNANVHAVGSAANLASLVSDANANGYQFYAETGMGGSSQTDNAPTATRDYTGTNNQVSGVDEGDIVKTDGFNIYYAARYENKIRVVSVGNDHVPTLETTIDLGMVYTDSLYLTEKYLIIVGYRYDISKTGCGIAADDSVDYCLSYMWWQPTGTVVIIDRSTNATVYSLQTDSFFMDHRLIGDSLFLVGYKYMYYYTQGTDLRPTFSETRGETTEQFVMGYNAIYYFDETPAYGMKVLTGLKLNDDSSLIAFHADAFLGSSPDYSKMYVNDTSLYLAETVYHYEETTSYTRMTISRYDINVDTASLVYRAAGIVDGTSLNQFSMDEYEGYLRVATTNRISTWSENTGFWWGWDSSSEVINHLYVLQLDDETDSFLLIGHLSDGLGNPNESITSVRFTGETAYVVTFERHDPLYIIDMSDPTHPSITGTIEQNGYDTYQHPWGTGKLVGIGYDADDNGMVTGMKISAYDTSGTEPSLVQTYKLFSYDVDGETSWTYGYSEALWNPKALLVSVEHGIIGFAVQAYEYGYRTVEGTRSVDVSGSETSSETADTYYNQEWYCNYHSYYYIFKIDFASNTIIQAPAIVEHPVSTDYYVNVDRGILIENYVYTISNREVITYSLADKAIFEPNLYFE